ARAQRQTEIERGSTARDRSHGRAETQSRAGFADALSCIDQCFIADEMLEHLPVASQVGKTIVGGIDLNKARIRHVVEALIALSPLPNGFIASDVAARVRALSKQSQSEYGPRHAAYDL